MNLPFDIQLRAAGIPEPVTEHKFYEGKMWVKVKTGKKKGQMVYKTRLWRFDYAWPDKMIALECDGGLWVKGRHVNPLGYLGDLEKLGEAFALGWSVLRVSPQQLENGTAVRWLKARMEKI